MLKPLFKIGDLVVNKIDSKGVRAFPNWVGEIIDVKFFEKIEGINGDISTYFYNIKWDPSYNRKQTFLNQIKKIEESGVCLDLIPHLKKCAEEDKPILSAEFRIEKAPDKFTSAGFYEKGI